MLPEWSAALIAKAKVAALLSAALAAGGVGGAVALSHVSPTPTTVTTAADSTSVDPETQAAQDPETQAAQDPESGDAQGGYQLPPCPSDVKNHGEYVSSVARSAPKGKGGVHGHWVSQAAHSDCGKSGSTDAQDPETQDAQDPETQDAQDPETQDSTDPETGGATSAPAPVKPSHESHGSHGHGLGHSKH